MKKILPLLLIVGGIYFFFKYYLPQHGVSGVLKSVQGIQTTVQNQDYKKFIPDKQSSSTSAITTNKNILQNIQNQVSQLKLSEISSSSSQIQQIIKQLQKLPNDKIKATCVQLCSGL